MTATLDNLRVKRPIMDETTGQVFESLFEEHWERVYGVIFRLVGDSAEAEDLALEVFWRLHEQPPPSDEPARLRGWLYRVATNLGYNALRAQKRREYYELRAARSDPLRQPGKDPAALAEQAEERQHVRSILAKMRPRTAKLLVLRYSGLSYAEIARALRIAPGSVGTLLARAERAFAQKYRDLEGR